MSVESNQCNVHASQLLHRVWEIIQEGTARRIRIRDAKGATYLEIPLTVGLVGMVIAPVLAAVGTLAVMASQFTIEVERWHEEGETA